LILNTDGMKPIYIQISEWLEMEILAGNFKTDEKIYSQYQLAEMFVINPATAAKGLNMLVDENILYKKRGLGMFVSPNGKAVILEKRKSQTLKKIILEMLTEAERLGVDDEELIQMINILRNQSREE
jgi:GntR family transcriptional regulator